MNHNEIVKKLNVVSFDVSSVSGTITREPGETGNSLVFTSGSVRYIDPKHLRDFTAARQAANRLCRAYGVRFLSGWAVPDENLDVLTAELAKLAKKVDASKSILVANWDTFLAEWREQNPTVASYSARFPKAGYTDTHVGARLAVYRIQPQAAMAGVEDGIQAEVTGLASRVLSEIAQDVSDTWNPSASQASQRIKNLLARVKHKFETLSFLGGSLGNMAVFVEQALIRLPVNGAISGPDYAVLAGILGILSSPEQMVKTASMIDASGISGTEHLFVSSETEVQAVITQQEQPEEVVALSPAIPAPEPAPEPAQELPMPVLEIEAKPIGLSPIQDWPVEPNTEPVVHVLQEQVETADSSAWNW